MTLETVTRTRQVTEEYEVTVVKSQGSPELYWHDYDREKIEVRPALPGEVVSRDVAPPQSYVIEVSGYDAEDPVKVSIRFTLNELSTFVAEVQSYCHREAQKATSNG